MPQRMHPNYSTPEASMSGGINLSDRDLMQLMLNEHKLMTTSMTNCVLECAHPQLRQECLNLLNKDFEHQKLIWEAMHQRGWYNVPMASPEEMQQMQQQFSQPAISGQPPMQSFTQPQPYQTPQAPYPQQNYVPTPYTSPSFTHMQRS